MTPFLVLMVLVVLNIGEEIPIPITNHRRKVINFSQSHLGFFFEITYGFVFSCGILVNNSTIMCWGSDRIGKDIESQFGNMSMVSIMAGGSHVCGVNSAGFLVCKGNNSSG